MAIHTGSLLIRALVVSLLGVLLAPAAAAQRATARPTPVSTRVLYENLLHHDPLPEYPPEAAAAGVSGLVRVRVVLKDTGEIESVEAISGPAALRDAATDAVESWTFIAVRVRGAYRRVTGVVVLRFGTGESGPAAWLVGPKGEQLREGDVGVMGGVPGAAPPPPEPEPWDPPADAHHVMGVLAGKAIERPQPVYPAMARAAKVGGAVVVEVVVDETGHVVMARAISGHPLLRDASAEAARGWIFTPTELDGKPVKLIGTITFNFHTNR